MENNGIEISINDRILNILNGLLREYDKFGKLQDQLRFLQDVRGLNKSSNYGEKVSYKDAEVMINMFRHLWMDYNSDTINMAMYPDVVFDAEKFIYNRNNQTFESIKIISTNIKLGLESGTQLLVDSEISKSLMERVTQASADFYYTRAFAVVVSDNVTKEAFKEELFKL